MLIYILFLLTLLVLVLAVKSDLTLEKIDAIADLSSIAVKYFSQAPYLKYTEPEDKVMNAFAWSVAEMWEENESSLYVLTRLANLVDERDQSNGQLTMTAKVIRSFAEQSESRRVHVTEAEEEDGFNWNGNASIDGIQSGDEALNQMYIRGESQATDYKVSRILQIRWTNLEKAIQDIEHAGRRGYSHLISAMIRMGSDHRTLKYIAPELKAGLCIKLMSLPAMKMTPSAAKWLLTMDTYREDQLKLVKVIEKALMKRQLEKSMSTQYYASNDLARIFTELETIGQPKEISDHYFDDVMSVDGFMPAERFYKTMKMENKQQQEKVLVEQKDEETVKQQKEEKANVEQKEEESNVQNSKNPTTPEAQNTQQQQEQSDSPTSSNTTTTTTDNDEKPNRKSYFEEQNEREDLLDQIIADNKDEENYDEDGVYDSQEQAKDRAGQIVALILVALVLVAGVGSYAFLRLRRARRSRTMVAGVNGIPDQSLSA